MIKRLCYQHQYERGTDSYRRRNIIRILWLHCVLWENIQLDMWVRVLRWRRKKNSFYTYTHTDALTTTRKIKKNRKKKCLWKMWRNEGSGKKIVNSEKKKCVVSVDWCKKMLNKGTNTITISTMFPTQSKWFHGLFFFLSSISVFHNSCRCKTFFSINSSSYFWCVTNMNRLCVNVFVEKCSSKMLELVSKRNYERNFGEKSDVNATTKFYQDEDTMPYSLCITFPMYYII